jgi:hypothetical protein
MRMNVLMRPIYDDLANHAPCALPAEREAGVSEGLVLIDGCLYLRAHLDNLTRVREPTATGRERWVNKIPLDSPLDPSDPAWRPQLLGWGLVIARRLLLQARELRGPSRVQAYIWLQPAPTVEVPEYDFAAGAVLFYGVREEGDDRWALPEDHPGHPERVGQPLLTLSDGDLVSADRTGAYGRAMPGRGRPADDS